MPLASALEYLKIRTGVFLLQAVAPLSIIYVVVRTFNLGRGFVPWSAWTAFCFPPFALWLFLEFYAFIFFYLPYKYWYLQRPAKHPPPLPKEEREVLFARCLATVRNPEYYLKWWFRGAKAEDIRRENVRELISWAFFNAVQIHQADEDELESYVDAIGMKLGRPLQPGRGKAIALRTTLNPVQCCYRPLIWNVIVAVCDAITHVYMLYNGFSFYRTSHWRCWAVLPFRPLTLFARQKSSAKHVTYWYRPHTAKDRLPVLFIHGVGIGLWPYATFLRDINRIGCLLDDLTSDTSIGIIAIEIHAVSSRITSQASDKDILVHEINSILTHHNWERFVLASHSYGTVISTHLLHSPLTSPRIGPVVLIDPICFLLHLPDVAYNFTVRTPRRWRPKEWVLWYFGSMDLGIAHTLGRRFFWSENVLWKEEEGVRGRDMSVVLSGRDDIVNVRAVREYLNPRPHPRDTSRWSRRNSSDALLGVSDGGANEEEGNLEDALTEWKGRGLETVWLDGLHHAQPFDFEASRDHVVKILRTYTRRTGVDESL